MNTLNTSNLRIFKVKYLGPTNYKGSRVQIKDERFNKIVIIPYDYEYNNALEIAASYLLSLGFETLYGGEGQDNMYLATPDFQTQIK